MGESKNALPSILPVFLKQKLKRAITLVCQRPIKSYSVPLKSNLSPIYFLFRLK